MGGAMAAAASGGEVAEHPENMEMDDLAIGFGIIRTVFHESFLRTVEKAETEKIQKIQKIAAIAADYE